MKSVRTGKTESLNSGKQCGNELPGKQLDQGFGLRD
jgi:hypothetical protein